ncbi:hypothetical protein [Bacillus cereus]|uniref:Uncharacterized protein n=1 Tax=Bacillus cereus HuA3-9 TaxID=1053205 RepID=R8CI83_BACCE|nr:hypothetical protein [Bacillus cereus]EOO11293.1 hypothetical protein IGA_05556 [Bacillus cereus HuA3-9]
MHFAMEKQKYWNQVEIAEIKSISGVGGRFGDDMDVYFIVFMKDGSTAQFHYNSRIAYEKRRELKKLYNEFNNVPETYKLMNEADIQVGGVSIPFGVRVDNSLDESEYKTLLEIEELTKQGKIIDNGVRQLAYICLLDIQNGKIVRGTLTDAYRKQLDAMGITYED